MTPDIDMRSRGLLTCILVVVIFIIPVLPPVASAITLPATAQVKAAVIDYYYSARTILYASLAISIANVTLAYKVLKKQE
jgi:hypothetical protein